MVGQFGLGGGKQVDLGVDLGGQLSEGDRGVVAVQLQGGAGSIQPLLGASGALPAVGGCADEPDQPSPASSQQRMGSA